MSQREARIPDAYARASEAFPSQEPDLEVWGCLGTVRWRQRPTAARENVLQQLYGRREGTGSMWFDVPVMGDGR